MLTFRQLDDLPQSVIKIMSETEQKIISDIARRINKTGTITESANWQMLRLEQLGAAQEKITRELSRALNKTEAQLVELFDEAATRTINADNRMYEAAGYEPVDLANNEYLQRIIRIGLARTQGTYENLTGTIANTTSRIFERALDLAHQKIVSGAFSYQQAVRDAIKSFAGNGLSVEYPSGRIESIEAAFRRATLTGANQTAAEISLEAAGEYGVDLVETTAHAGARPEHALWQGKVFSISGKSSKYPDFYSETGYGTGAGLCGWNCRHNFFPYFEGLSDPAYTTDMLRGYNNKTVTYNDDSMDLYEATQHQRYIERQIRRWKREDNTFASTAKSEANETRKAELLKDSRRAHGKVLHWQAAQRDFLDQTGLQRDYFRERVA